MTLPLADKPQPLALINAAGHALDPRRLFQVPGDGLGQAGFETLARLPAQFAFDLAWRRWRSADRGRADP